MLNGLSDGFTCVSKLYHVADKPSKIFKGAIRMFEFAELFKIKVVGVGRSGINAVNKMVESQLPPMEFIAVSNKKKHLADSQAEQRLLIGKNISKLRADFEKIVEGADIVFIIAGGSIGEEIVPIMAECVCNIYALTIALVILPFNVENLLPNDTFFAIPNDNNTDEIIFKTIQSIYDSMNMPGIVNLNFADIHTFFLFYGEALVGIGEAKNLKDAVNAAINFPLLKDNLKNARRIFITFTGSKNSLEMIEVNDISNVVQNALNKHTEEFMYSILIDENLGYTVRVTIIATRFDDKIKNFRAPIIFFNHNKNFDNDSINIPPWMK